MRLNTNMLSLNAGRSFRNVNHALEKSLARLSSGFRINSAADDASGLAISEKVRANMRGLNQANRNIQDGISLVQTADGALGTIHAILQRGRELAVQAANGTLTKEDAGYLQQEVTSLIAEVDRIVEATEFNGRRILGGSDPRVAQLVEGLRRTWLATAEKLVADEYGLSASNMPINIVAAQSHSHPAYARWWSDGTKVTRTELVVNLSAYQNYDLPNGGSAPNYLDRMIAHEMVHLAMYATIGVTNYENFRDLPEWFLEGTAEFIHGRDRSLAYHLGQAGSTANFVNRVDSWGGQSFDYSVAYAATKYLHQAIIDSGDAAGIRTVIQALTVSGTTLDAAISAATNGLFADEAAFINSFKSAAGGIAYLNNLDLSMPGGDTGSIRPGFTAENVMDDSLNVDTWDPLVGFIETWPQGPRAQDPVGPLQVGALAGQKLALPEIDVNAWSLGIASLNIVEDPGNAIIAFDKAIDQVSSIRGTLGAIQNRLEYAHAVNAATAENLTATESKIRDTDMALEMAALAKQQILAQSSASMMAQANNLRRSQVQMLLGA